MTNLHIGTILIGRKDSLFEITEGNKYPIANIDETYIYFIDDKGSEDFMSIHLVESNFTIKRYTLSDLKERKIAVRLTKKDDFIKICNLLGYIPNSGDYSFTEYHAVDEDNEFVWCNFDWLKDNGYILLESIDEIDLGEGKEDEPKKEVKLYPFYYYAKGNYSCNCAVCKKDFQGDKRATMCLECAIKQHHKDMDFTQSEIARLKGELDKSQEAGKCIAEKLADEMKEVKRLKGENERLKSDLGIAVSQLEILQIKESTHDLTKRERMAWELIIKSIYSGKEGVRTMDADQALDIADEFLAKSKEVKP